MKSTKILASIALLAPIHTYAQPMTGPLPAINIGQTARVVKPMMACPNKGDVSVYVYSLVNAEKNRDPAAAKDAMDAALDRGCRQLNPGDQGVLLAFNGVLHGWIKLVMTDDHQTYWTSRRVITEVPPSGLPYGWSFGGATAGQWP